MQKKTKVRSKQSQKEKKEKKEETEEPKEEETSHKKEENCAFSLYDLLEVNKEASSDEIVLPT